MPRRGDQTAIDAITHRVRELENEEADRLQAVIDTTARKKGRFGFRKDDDQEP